MKRITYELNGSRKILKFSPINLAVAFITAIPILIAPQQQHIAMNTKPARPHSTYEAIAR
jgi:hypothetical protein